MAIPATAIALAETMDPRDIRDFVLDLTALLEAGEAFTGMTVSPLAESAALGFEIRSAPPYAPVELTNSTIRLWFSVADANQLDAGFDGSGKVCAVEVEASTDSVPPRRFQRTATVRVAQR